MARITSVGTAVPRFEIRQQDIQEFARTFFAPSFKDIDRFIPVFSNSQIERRCFCVPLQWFAEDHSFSEKNALYVEYATALGCEAADAALQAAGVTPGEIDHILFVSSTGVSTPSIDVFIANRMGMNPHIKRTPVWGLGCAGGAAALGRAYDLTRAHPEHRVLLIAVELCGLTFQYRNRSKSNLIAASLFSDGAAAALIEGDSVKRRPPVRPVAADGQPCNPVRTGNETGVYKAVELVSCMSTLWRDTTDVMGWHVTDHGLDVIFSRDIPALVKEKMRPEVDLFLEATGLKVRDISHAVVHPGGAKVLDAYRETLGLTEEQLSPAREVLRQYGNMSSCTVLFVLQEAMRAPGHRGDYTLSFALGPGFSCEQILLQWA